MNLLYFIDNANVGDVIKVKFKDGNEYELVKYHNDIIGTRDCPLNLAMDLSFEKHDWETSDLKFYIEYWFEKNAPDELKELCSVTIPCATNVFGDKYKGKYYNDDKNEIQWDFFKDWHNRIKTILNRSANEEGKNWWLCSPYADDIYCFVIVDNGGGLDANHANLGGSVALCFIKKVEE